jgi:predicted phage tail protein
LAATARSYVAKGLTNTSRSYFVVRAINAVGTGPPSTEVSAVPAGAPHRPTGLVAYPGNGSAGLRWSAPDAENSSITGFNVYKGATRVNASPLPATARSTTVTGLANGTTYSFTARAVNASGQSPPSAAVSVTPTAAATPPTPPRNLAAAPGNGKATLTWTAPASNGGKPVTGFNVYKGALPDGEAASPVNPSPLPATATSYTVDGLANGAPAFFTVKAINSVGTSVASNEASTRPEAPATNPGAPRDVKVVAGNGKVTVTWSAPGWNGGRAVTGYFLFLGTTTGGQSTTPVNPSPIAANVTTYDVTGLTNGKRYFFVVKAANSIGRSTASNEESTTPKAAK